MLYYLASTLYVLACLLLLLVVLLQQGKGGDMASAFGGGGSQTAFGARAGATVLTRATTVLGVLFMLGAIVLGILGRQGPGSLMGGVAGPAPVQRQQPCASAGDDAARPRHATGSRRSADRSSQAPARRPRRTAAAERSRERSKPPDYTGSTDQIVAQHHLDSRKWRNWQTHQLEGLALARA